MKLWQKIFLWTLLIVMTAVSASGISILKNNYESSIDMQINNSLSEHQYMISNLKNRIIADRNKLGAILLSEDEIQNVFTDIFNANDNKKSTAINIYNLNHAIIYNNNPIEISNDLYTTILNNKDTYSLINHINKNHYLFIGSVITLERQSYIFITTSDISNIYNLYNSQLTYTKWLSGILSLISAFCLLILVKSLLSPLTKFNRATRNIANGDYSKRINIKGHSELNELATNMNIMVDSIEDNINLLQETADNRREFINNLTHEMKTPLTSILGFADILRIKRNITPHEITEYSGIILEEAKRLKNLSGKLMEIITVGETNLELQDYSSTELFSQIILTLKPIFNNNNINFDYSIEDCIISVDSELFKSMIYNLVDNAVKASKNGKYVNINGTYTSTNQSNGLFTISIADEGIGISEKDISKITEPFYMVDKARSRKAGGAGLGLALCKKIADIHNAEFKITSQVKVGTTVSILLPAISSKDSFTLTKNSEAGGSYEK